MPKKTKVDKKVKVLDVLRRATLAWDVSPRGTREEGVLDKLADEILEITK